MTKATMVALMVQVMMVLVSFIEVIRLRVMTMATMVLMRW